MVRASLLVLGWCVAPAVVFAAEKTGGINGIVKIKGVTVAEAAPVVLYVTGFNEEPDKASARITQRDKKFVPDVMPITVGQTVDFANEDTIWHNVFSISKARAFDLGMTKKPDTKAITFTKTGVIDVYCNIHPEMVGTVLVLPNRAFTVADKDGRYRIQNVPAGDYKMFAWSKRSDVQSKPVTVAAGDTLKVDWEVVQDKVPEKHKDKFGKEYKPGGQKY
jgi:plastocyanin